MADGDLIGVSPSISGPGTSSGDYIPSPNAPDPGGDQPSASGAPDPNEGDPVLQTAWDHYKLDEQREKESDVYYQKMRDQINEIDQRIRSTPLPEVPTQEQIPDPRQTQQKQNTLGTMIGQLLTIGMIGSAVFGKHRNPWATAALYNGFGSFINGYEQGRTQLANQQHQNWHDLAEYIQKENEQKTKTYNEVLANKRLDLQQQMDVLKAISAQRQDTAMYAAASSKDLSQVMKVLDDKFKAGVSLSKSQLHIGSAAISQWVKGPGYGWSQHVIQETNGKLIPSRSLEEFDQARKQFPISDWLKTHTAGKPGKPETYAGLAKEVEAAVGKAKADDWMKALETDQYKRGDVKEETTQGWFGPETKKKWVPSASGKSYSFGETDAELQENAKPAKVIEDLKRRYQNIGQGTGGATQQDNDPTLSAAEARKQPAGRTFWGTNGKHYRVVSQSPFQIHEIKPEEERSSEAESPSGETSSEEESSD